MDIATIYSNLETTETINKLLLQPYQMKISSQLSQGDKNNLGQAMELTTEEAFKQLKEFKSDVSGSWIQREIDSYISSKMKLISNQEPEVDNDARLSPIDEPKSEILKLNPSNLGRDKF